MNYKLLLFLPFVKLNKSGSGFPFGSLVLISLSSSKKACCNTSNGINRSCGGYTKTFDIKSIASGGVLDLKTLKHNQIYEGKFILMPRMRFNLREFKLCIIRIHCLNLLFSRCSQHFYYLYKLIYSTFSRE